MLYAILQELCASGKNAECTVPCRLIPVIPPEAKEKVKFVKANPLSSFTGILRSSAFVLGGGTHIFDFGIKRRVVQILCRILLMVMFARTFGKKVYLIGNGVGPLTSGWGTTLARLICQMADSISVRDGESYKYLEKWGLTGKAVLSFDLSALIEPAEIPETAINNGRNVLGLSVSPVYEIYYNDKNWDIQMVEKIAEVVNSWLETEPESEVWLFVFKGKSMDDDVLITERLREQLKPREKVKIIDYDPSPANTLARISRCHVFIGTRYHSSLFAYLSGIPLIVLNYHSKCRALAEDIGLPEKAIVSLSEILDGNFSNRLKNLIKSPGDFLATLPTDTARKRAKDGIIGVIK